MVVQPREWRVRVTPRVLDRRDLQLDQEPAPVNGRFTARLQLALRA